MFYCKYLIVTIYQPNNKKNVSIKKMYNTKINLPRAIGQAMFSGLEWSLEKNILSSFKFIHITKQDQLPTPTALPTTLVEVKTKEFLCFIKLLKNFSVRDSRNSPFDQR